MLKSMSTIAVVLIATTAGAASFDCDQASKADEKAICENRALNDADVKMSTMFDIATKMVAMGERDGMRTAQLKWLENRSACAANLDCLLASMASELQISKRYLRISKPA